MLFLKAAVKAVITFVCNAKNFAVAFVFLLPVLLVSVFGQTDYRSLLIFLQIVIQNTCD